MPALSRLVDSLFLVLWVAALVAIFWPHPWLGRAIAAGVAVYAVLAFVGARRPTQLLCTAMALAALGLTVWTGAWTALPRAGEAAGMFAAFFGTLTLMRATADTRPEIAQARALVARLQAGERASGLTVGAHFLGAVLVVSVMAVFAPIVGRDASAATRLAAAEACQRGMCLACLWSPFWLAMAFCFQHLPNVKLWQIMSLGLALAAIGLVLAQAMYARGLGFGGLWRALQGFAPVLPPLALAASVVLALSALTQFSGLQALVLGIPVLCAAGLFAQGIDRLRGALAQTVRSVGTVSSEMVLVSVALALARVLEGLLHSDAVNAFIESWAPPPSVVIAVVVGGITALSLVGVHQLVGATVMLAVFAALPLGVADVILMEAVLIGWAFASMCGISAVSVAAAGSMFGVPMERVAYGANLRFIAVYGVVLIAALTAVNAAI